MKFIAQETNENDKFDFLCAIREWSGFSFEEKHKLCDLLINFGVPVHVDEESKDDWELLKVILTKMTKGDDEELHASSI